MHLLGLSEYVKIISLSISHYSLALIEEAVIYNFL